MSVLTAFIPVSAARIEAACLACAGFLERRDARMAVRRDQRAPARDGGSVQVSNGSGHGTILAEDTSAVACNRSWGLE